MGRTSEQLKVLQSVVIRPVGLVIANSYSMKCGRTSSSRSLLKAGVVFLGHPGRSIALCVCPQNLFVSSVSVSQQTQQINNGGHCKNESVVLLQGFGVYSMSWEQSGSHVAARAWSGLRSCTWG